MRQYGATLAQTLRNLHNPNVRVVFDGVDVDLPIETAVPVALIMNEALTNAFKYGIPEEPGRRGSLPEILLAMRVEGDKFVLEVRDYGRGMASELCKNPGTSLGVQIMQSLSRQIRGEASWSNESGTVFRLSIALPEHSKVR